MKYSLVKKNSQNQKNQSQSERAVSTMAQCIIVGCLSILLFALRSDSVGEFYAVLGVCLLIAGACVLSGGLLGFLFGIPRTLQRDNMDKTNLNGTENKNLSDNSVSYQVNTNLEQISDWLTKILVGIGLTQITALPEAVKNFSEFASLGLGENPASKIFAVAILVYYTVCGFLTSYLWTRLYLAGALRIADMDAVGEQISEMQNKVSEIERQSVIDAKALSVVQRQLNPGPGSLPLTQDEINSAILPASSSVKTQIYYLSQNVRSNNWKDHQTKYIMERTIPVFRALIASDTENVFHENHGQLGFALKDQRQPDWANSLSELNKAIEIRGRWEEEGWLMYEFNRAICMINLDDGFREGKSSPEEIRNRVHDDLKVAEQLPDLNRLIAEDHLIQDWLKLNKIGSSPVPQC